MHVTLINPNVVTQKGDFFSSGIPYMPSTLAYAASWLRDHGHNVHVIDAFGENPEHVWHRGEFMFQGLTADQVVERINDTDAIVCYASLVYCHESLKLIINAINKTTQSKIYVLENTQSVNAYSLRKVQEEIFNLGVYKIISGEPEPRIIQALENTPIDGVFEQGETNPPVKFQENLDQLSFPAWDLFPIQNYWTLGYAHGPLTGKKYLALLTSRGCPYVCSFCVVPETNERKWRKRSALNVIAEMEHFYKKYGVTEFHIEDLNPTIDKARMKEIANIIIQNKLPFTYKIASGTKIETVDLETLDVMANGGLKFLSFSPESGSPEMLKLMKKPFDHKFALEVTKYLNKKDVFMQACFVLGHPGEGEKERTATKDYIKALTRAGVDEIALFIVTPIPGSSIHLQTPATTITSLSQLTFSPKWRDDYKLLNSFRWELYRKFLFWRILYHPVKVLKQIGSVLSGRFRTKMGMTCYRVLRLKKFSM